MICMEMQMILVLKYWANNNTQVMMNIISS